MFFTNKKKNVLARQPNWLHIDSNVQLLPGLIEGPQDVDTACLLISQLAALGLEKIVLIAPINEQSPITFDTIQRGYQSVCQKLLLERCEMEVMLAGIYRLEKGFMSLLKKNELIPMSGHYVLFDLPLDAEPPFIENIIFELEVNGFTPVLACPERYVYYHQLNLKRYRKLKSLGCLFQSSLLSLAGYYGDKTKRMAQTLLKEGLIDMSGSGINSEIQVKVLVDFVKNQNIF
ncbi:Tyrosine-protein phosphatase YwqE [bacterium A37T11]|nr:Tyrosine-protein phosphatase YwqE [bacterium A37T11]